MPKTLTVLALCLAGALTGCDAKPAGQRAQEQLAALQKKRAEAAKAEKIEPLAPLPTNLLKLDQPYDDLQSPVLLPDGPCPEGLWALFPGDGPGLSADKKRSAEEQKASQARKAALAASFAGKTFMAKFRGAGQVVLHPFDAPNGRFVIDVPGTVDCVDEQGRIAIAWTEAKSIDPGAETKDLAQNLWQARPVPFEVAMTSLSDAKSYFDKNHLGLSARVVFTFGKTEVDKKLKRAPKISRDVAGEKLTMGGADEDWGAGRLVHATLVGVRVAADRERTQLFDQRPK